MQPIRQKKTVYGFVRKRCDGLCIPEIIEIIFQFYLISIPSEILYENEQISLYNLLFETLKKQKEYANIKSIDAKLLYRASEHAFSADKFHECCDDKGANIVIIHNEYNYVFGGFTSKSWTNKDVQIKDPNAFPFVVRPTIQAFGFKESQINGEKAVWGYKDCGPCLCDIWISDECNTKKKAISGTLSQTFRHTVRELCGSDRHYKVREYEVFSVVIHRMKVPDPIV